MADWLLDAKCAQIGGEVFFPTEESGTAEMHMARELCFACPVRLECLDVAMKAEAGLGRTVRYGLFGGLTPRQRWQLDPVTGDDAKVMHRHEAGGSAA